MGRRGGRSTTTTTAAACSARCSAGRLRCSPEPVSFPAGPPSDEAVVITRAYRVDVEKPWVMQSLFLSAIGDARDQRAQRARDLRLPLPRRRAAPGSLPGAQDRLPARLPGGLRLSHGTDGVELVRLEFGGVKPMLEGEAREGHSRREGGLSASPGAAAALSRGGRLARFDGLDELLNDGVDLLFGERRVEREREDAAGDGVCAK